jgi:hypothetical protein
MNQNSCENTSEIKNLETCSGAENLSSQCSEIASDIEKLEVKSQEEKEPENTQESSSSSESTTKASEQESSSATSSSTSQSDEEPTKRKRKRKRHHKKKPTTAYDPPRPFTARYKKFKILEPTVLPKLHIRFDDCTGEPDKTSSVYNSKPRIIEALKKNLSLLESLKEVSQDSSPVAIDDVKYTENVKILNHFVISLKPRIIKAIVVT